MYIYLHYLIVLYIYINSSHQGLALLRRAVQGALAVDPLLQVRAAAKRQGDQVGVASEEFQEESMKTSHSYYYLYIRLL